MHHRGALKDSFSPRSRRGSPPRDAGVCVLLLSLVLPTTIRSEGPILLCANCLAIGKTSDSLCLFRDRRLSAARVDSLWETGESSDYGRSELRRLSASGRPTASRSLAPLSKLDSARIGSSSWLLVTEDISCGFGSYAGPTTHVLDLSNPSRIRDARDRKGNGIVLARTLKTVWKHVSDGFLMAACRPEFDSSRPNSTSFYIRYERLRLRNGRWIRSERKTPGFTEFDEGFPDPKLFPE